MRTLQNLSRSFDDEFLIEQRYEIDRSGMRLTLTEWMIDIYLRFRTYWRNQSGGAETVSGMAGVVCKVTYR